MLERHLLKRSLDEWSAGFRRMQERLRTRIHRIRLSDPQALALVGVRRCGKTSMACELAKPFGDAVLYFNFEDPIFFLDSDLRNLDALLSVYVEYHRHEPKLVIWDEIQNIRGWERWVRKSVDLAKYRLMVTGSSSQLLSSEIATAITGRCIESKIWPLSFAEYLGFSEQPHNAEANLLLAEVRHFLLWGGFPEVVLEKDEMNKKQILLQYLSDIVLRDVMHRHEIRSRVVLDQLLIYYSTNISSLHSYSALRNAFGMSLEVAADYTAYLEEAFLFFPVKRYHPNLKVQTRDPYKIYGIDTGLRNVYAHTASDDLGKCLENAVYIHLRRGNHEVYYYKGHGEVDFVVTHLGKPKAAMQVCDADLLQPHIHEREVSALVECLQATKLRVGIIITRSQEESFTIEGKTIQCIPAFRWLASEPSFG